LALLSTDPYRFVLWAFPWGERGQLEGKTGPEEWQREMLCSIRDGLLTPNVAIQRAIASGHGIGKSTFVAWIILWALSTLEDTRGVVTANTETQLKTKTWVELAKWHRLFIAKELFDMTATRLAAKGRDDTWRIDMVPWSERNTEAFAGLHNEGKRILVVFDEGSAIPDNIWETTEGALTDKDTQIIWFVAGNPTRSVGRFRECFPGGRHQNVWRSQAIDSRSVSITNKDQINKWISAYGEDSDFVRIRVKGVFPRAGAMEFIPVDLVDQAMEREDVGVHMFDPLVLGVDVARFGDDETVIAIRKGRDGRTFPPVRLRGLDTMQVAGKVAELFGHYHADALFVDEGGVGGGVVDRLRQLHVPCIGINFGSAADNVNAEDPNTAYANKRAEMYGALRSWLRGATLPKDADYREQLIATQYGFNANNAIQLEKKEDLKKRGMASPDMADALALTFAYPVHPHRNAGFPGQQQPPVEFEYNPFARTA